MEYGYQYNQYNARMGTIFPINVHNILKYRTVLNFKNNFTHFLK